MPDFTISADSIDVEQIMRQIRARIREKRGVDYTEEQIRELAAAKLERFLDPTGVRSELLEQFRKRPSLPPGFLYEFEDTTLFDSDKAIVRFFRRLLRPVLKLFFNPNVLSNTLHRQAAFNQYVYAHQPLQFELLHNLVLELTRAGIELRNLKMRLESVQSRLEFNERRARALEAVVQYKPDTARGRGEDRGERRQARPEPARPQPVHSRAPQPPVATRGDVAEASAPATTEPQGGVDPITGGESVRTRRRRRRRGRRGTWDPASAGLPAGSAGLGSASADTQSHPGPAGPETTSLDSSTDSAGPWDPASVPSPADSAGAWDPDPARSSAEPAGRWDPASGGFPVSDDGAPRAERADVQTAEAEPDSTPDQRGPDDDVR